MYGKIIIWVIIVMVIIALLAALWMFHYALDASFSKILKKFIKNKKELEFVEEKKWFVANAHDTYITSFDNLNLHGFYIQGKNPSHKYVILLHGYKTSGLFMAHYAIPYYEKDWNILVPEHRAHGKSEGRFITMGFLESKDILQWINFIIEKDANAEIVLHGVSMGASTVILTIGNSKLPKNVIAGVEDCGYTSAKEEFSYQIKTKFKLPSFPIIPLASFFAKLGLGVSFKDIDCIKALKKNTTPILFIHGDADTFVPFEMEDKLYIETSAKKEKVVIEGATHAKAVSVNPIKYWDSIWNFLEKMYGVNVV